MEDDPGGRDERPPPPAAGEAAPPAAGRRGVRGCLVGGATTAAASFALFAGVLAFALDGCDLVLLFADPCSEEVDGGELHLAAGAGDLDEVRRLLDDGADPEREVDGDRPLSCAIRGLRHEVAATLVDAGARAGEAEADDAARSRDLAMVDLVLDAGADPTIVLERVATDGEIMGIDELSLLGGSRSVADPPAPPAELAAAALGAGADPGGRGDAMTPLLRAAYRGDADLVEVLVTAGADPDHGGPVVDWVLGSAGVRLVDGAGSAPGELPPVGTADPSVLPAPSGTAPDVSPLIGAATGGDLATVEVLLAAGADPDLLAGGRFHVLHAAAARGDLAMVEVLLAAGATPDPSLPPDVPTPAETAERTGHPAVAARLRGG